jgi:hypothetical protein
MDCKVANCNNPVSRGGMCSMHYWRQRRHGDPTVTHLRGPKPRPQPTAMSTAESINLHHELTRLRREVASLRAEDVSLRSERTALRRKVAELEQKIADAWPGTQSETDARMLGHYEEVRAEWAFQRDRIEELEEKLVETRAAKNENERLKKALKKARSEEFLAREIVEQQIRKLNEQIKDLEADRDFWRSMSGTPGNGAITKKELLTLRAAFHPDRTTNLAQKKRLEEAAMIINKRFGK